MKRLVMSYFEETKWLYDTYIPSLEEYIKVSLVSGGYVMLSTTALVGMGDEVSKQDLDWIISVPLIDRASAINARVMNDLVGDEVCGAYVHYLLPTL